MLRLGGGWLRQCPHRLCLPHGAENPRHALAASPALNGGRAHRAAVSGLSGRGRRRCGHNRGHVPGNCGGQCSGSLRRLYPQRHARRWRASGGTSRLCQTPGRDGRASLCPLAQAQPWQKGRQYPRLDRAVWCRLSLFHYSRRRQHHEPGEPVAPGGRYGGQPTRWPNPDRAAPRRRQNRFRAPAAVCRRLLWPNCLGGACRLARTWGQLLGTQRHHSHRSVRQFGRPAAAAGTAAAGRARSQPRLRRSRLAATGRLGGASGAIAWRLL